MVTFATRPESTPTLEHFYRACRPGGPGWLAVARRCGLEGQHPALGWSVLDWIAGCLLVWSCVLAVGTLLLGAAGSWIYALTAVLTALFLGWRLRAG